MKVAIIGTGFLGEQIFNDVKDSCEDIILTHNKNKKYPQSKKFNFFSDDISQIIGDLKIDLIFLSAKIEFIEDAQVLGAAMAKFLKVTKNSRVVYISSDGIFDGQQGSYTESDIPSPVTLYGKNLQMCEELLRASSDNYCIVRPSYIYGYVSSVLDSRFKKVIEEVDEGKKLIRFTDMYKSPLSYQQAAQAIVELAMSDYVGTVHISGERMSVYEFTKQGMEALGISTENLIGKPMPNQKPLDFLADTSLDNSLMRKLTSVEPFSIKEGFKNSRDTSSG